MKFNAVVTVVDEIAFKLSVEGTVPLFLASWQDVIPPGVMILDRKIVGVHYNRIVIVNYIIPYWHQCSFDRSRACIFLFLSLDSPKESPKIDETTSNFSIQISSGDAATAHSRTRSCPISSNGLSTSKPILHAQPPLAPLGVAWCLPFLPLP
jgi:hypothetical protein